MQPWVQAENFGLISISTIIFGFGALCSSSVHRGFVMGLCGGILVWDENAMVLIGSAFRSRFFRQEDGSATLESVLWLPVFIAFLTLAADASFVFYGQNQAYRIVQNANRSLSVGRLLSEEEVVDYLSAELSNLAPNAQVTATIDQGTITSIARIPVSDLAATRMFSALLDVNITVGARQYVEY